MGNSTVTEVQIRQQIQPYLDLVRIDLFVQHHKRKGSPEVEPRLEKIHMFITGVGAGFVKGP